MSKTATEERNVIQEFIEGADFPVNAAGPMYVPSTPSPPPSIHSPPSSLMMHGPIYEPMPVIPPPSAICYFFNTLGGCTKPYCHYLHISYDSYYQYSANLLNYPPFPAYNNAYPPAPFPVEETLEEDAEEGDYNDSNDYDEPPFEEDQLPPQPVNFYPYPYPYPVPPY